MPPARCNQCQEVFNSKAKCSKHASATGHTYQPWYFCMECSEVFTKNKELKAHNRATGHAVPTKGHTSIEAGIVSNSVSLFHQPPPLTRRCNLQFLSPTLL
ncbi:hypothetical protein C8Q80DRAFT_753687 [Daedaleopsis nitida]|nr:hypothetical protein C8Q80DRAFT_753687 [Daedaleopsis nitida]